MNKSHLRIATWNLERPGWRSPRLQSLRDAITAIDADILILTETHAAIDLGADYQSVASPPQALRRKGELTTVIWSRFPVGPHVPTFAAQPDRDAPIHPTYAVRGPAMSPAACAAVQTPLGSLLVYGTIITWLRDLGPQGTSPYAAEQYHAIAAHRADWAYVGAGQPMCVAGDFNVTLNGRSWGPLKARHALQAALDENQLICVTDTFEYCIDHICLSPAWAERVEARHQWAIPLRDGKKISDHKASAVDVRLD